MQVHPATSPLPADVFAMAFDKARQHAIIFGGEGPDGLNNATWSWDGTTWTNVSPRSGMVSPTARGGATMAFDEANNDIVLFGGSLLNPEASATNDTWLWNGTSWTNQAVSPSPAARTFATMAYDSVRHETLLFGGETVAGDGTKTLLNDTWAWNGTSWTQKTTPTSPPTSVNTASCFDRAHGQWVVLDGKVATSPMTTWLWNGTSWSTATTASSPPGRELFAFAYDEGRDRCLLFGGYDTGAQVNLADTWSWDGTSWTQLSLSAAPSARSAAAMVFDNARNVIVLFGGYVSGDVDETWLLGTP